MDFIAEFRYKRAMDSLKVNVQAILGYAEWQVMQVLRGEGLKDTGKTPRLALIAAASRDLAHTYLHGAIAQRFQHSAAKGDFQIDISESLERAKRNLAELLKESKLQGVGDGTMLARQLAEQIERSVYDTIGRGRGIGFTNVKISYAVPGREPN